MATTAQTYGLIDRNPPYSIEAEQSVLGAMMLSREAVADITEVLQTGDFYKDAHAKIFEVARSLYAKGDPIDPLTIAETLRTQGDLEAVGDRPYLHAIVSMVPTTANALKYAEIVSKLATLRRLIEAANRISAIGYNIPDDLDEALDEAENLIYQISNKDRDERVKDWKRLLEDTYNEMEDLGMMRRQSSFTKTGFKDLDEKILGMRPSDLVVIGARPSMGKTSLALNIAANVAINDNKPVVIFSLEMSDTELAQRMLCSQARVSSQDLLAGKFKDSDTEWRKLVSTMNTLTGAPIVIDDNAGINIMEMRSKLRRLKDRHDLGLVIVDYIQLMDFDRRVENRVQEIAAISRSLKVIGRDFNVPVIAVSQLSREPEKRQNRRPIMSDLRESGAIEQDADLILFIYREELYDKDNDDVKGVAELIIAKHRHGPTGEIKLTFNGNWTRFDDMPASSYRS
jgi:replicative DNA helicase